MDLWDDLGLTDGENVTSSQNDFDLTGEDENFYDPQRDAWLFEEPIALPEEVAPPADDLYLPPVNLGGTVENVALNPLETVVDVCKLIIEVALQPQGLARLKAMKVGVFFQKNTSHFLEFLKQLLYRGSLSVAHQVAPVVDGVKHKLSKAERIALLPIWSHELEKVMKIESSEVRDQFIGVWMFLRDHYVIDSTALAVPAHSHGEKKHTVEEYYQVRDDLAHVGLWIDACVENWRRWPTNGRGAKFYQLRPQMYGPEGAAINLGVILSPTVSTDDDLDVLRVFQSSIPAAKDRTGGVLRLTLAQRKGFPMMKPIFRHVINLAEQAVVRSLGHIQFIVIDPTETGYESKIFVGGVRYSWAQKSGGIKVFAAPLTRLASYPGLSDELVEAGRLISELLLPENITTDNDKPLVHAGGIRLHARQSPTSGDSVKLFRHLVAIGNRDGPWPIDIHVSVLPYGPSEYRKALDFLLCLSQVWARRLILSEELASRLLADGFTREFFWRESPFHAGWPRFRKEGNTYQWTPMYFAKKAGTVNMEELLTLNKASIAPSDGQPKFPRGRYGDLKQ